MSTNYYLINRTDEKNKDDFEDLIKKEVGELKKKLLHFNKIRDLGKEDELSEKLNYLTTFLGDGIIDTIENEICILTSTNLYWNITEQYANIEQFKEYFEKNKKAYFIADESRKELTLDEFLTKVQRNGLNIIYNH